MRGEIAEADGSVGSEVGGLWQGVGWGFVAGQVCWEEKMPPHGGGVVRMASVSEEVMLWRH